MLVLVWTGLIVGLAVSGFLLGRGWDKSKLKRDLLQCIVEAADLRVAFEKLLESHKRLRSSERMAQLRDARHAEPQSEPASTGLMGSLTLKDQLRVKAGLIPRAAVSTRAPSDA